MRTLMLVRHAAAGDAPGRSDHDRPLTGQGHAEAAGLAARLARHDLAPTLAVSSTAVRAEQTLAAVTRNADGLTTWTESELYLADAGALLRQVWRLPDEHACVLLVAHNPGIAQAAGVLSSDPDAIGWFPTTALAALRFAVDAWEQVRPGEGVLVAQSVP